MQELADRGQAAHRRHIRADQGCIRGIEFQQIVEMLSVAGLGPVLGDLSSQNFGASAGRRSGSAGRTSANSGALSSWYRRRRLCCRSGNKVMVVVVMMMDVCVGRVAMGRLATRGTLPG